MQMFQGTQLFSVEVGGRTLAIEAGLLAPQAGGAVTVRYGDTVLLATAVMSKDVRPGLNFFPLTVEFEERLYAAGRIPGSFFRREGKPSEQAILMSRLVDRPLRPLFPKGMRNEVQVIVTAIATDGQNLMDPLAIIAGSAALAISDIPWNGPLAGTTIGFVDGEFVVNPTAAQMEASGLSLVAAGTEDNILMVEAGANELPEDLVLDALHLAHETNRKVIATIQELRAALGKPKSLPSIFLPAAEVQAEVDTLVASRIAALLAQGLGKVELNSGLDAIQADLRATFAQRITDGTVAALDVEDSYEATLKKITRRRILENGIRPDGRTTTQIRPISVQVGNLPRVHGSGLFMRGETHVLTIATLGTPGDAQRLDSLLPGEEKRYMHHYNFPPFSTGEATPMRGPKRREIGHGALAERALVPVIPEAFPYTLRLVSEVLSSNGSTSMGSVCGSTLALMDAGVPITAPVAGSAMGLIQDMESGEYQVLSDIQGMEDALGDMDFKVAGTAHGITALQMDLKIKGLDFEILRRALDQARVGRLYIMEKMLAVLPEARESLSEYATRILTHRIDPEKIGKLIGPGGKTVRGLQENYGVKIDIEEDGTVYISGEGLSAERALAEVQRMTEDIEVGKIYTGTVVRVEPYGAFVNIMPGIDGMVHISQLADYRVDKVEDIANLGDELTAMVIDVDPGGKVRMSRQAVLEGWSVEEARSRDRGARPARGGERGGDRGGERGGERGGDRRGDRGGERGGERRGDRRR